MFLLRVLLSKSVDFVDIRLRYPVIGGHRAFLATTVGVMVKIARSRLRRIFMALIA